MTPELVIDNALLFAYMYVSAWRAPEPIDTSYIHVYGYMHSVIGSIVRRAYY